MAPGLCLLAAVGAWSAASAQGPGRFDGQYVGELTLTKTVRGDCTEPPLGALYPLTVAGGQVRFAYVPRFSTTLTGRVGDNGAFQASARLRNGAVRMSGQISGDSLIATILSPSCTYSFHTRN
jgi:hypothetical protein